MTAIRGTKLRPITHPNWALLTRWSRLTLLEQAQAVLDLRHPQLDLLELVARHEPELAEQPCETGAGPFAEPDGLAPPATDDLLDHRARLVAADPAAGRELLRQRVRPLGGQRDGADSGEDELLRDLAQLSALGHGAWPFGAGAVSRVSPAPSLTAAAAHRRAWARAARLPPARPVRGRASHRR